MKTLVKIISTVLLIALFLSMLSGCGYDKIVSDSIENSNSDNNENNNGNKNEKPDDGTNGDEVPDIEDVLESAYQISLDYEDYYGDIQTFVYGLIINHLRERYDVFPAFVQVENNEYVYGLAYTDYSNCYVNEDESVSYFLSGFAPFPGEYPVSEEAFNSGLIIESLDYNEDETVFVWYTRAENVIEHCVVFGQYLKYGFDDDGVITYEYEPYVRGYCDETLGTLYSYDQGRVVYDDNFGEYVPVTGKTLSDYIDYEAIQEEVNRAIREQDVYYSYTEMETALYMSYNAVQAFFLSLQEETFLGIAVDELIVAAQELDPLECFRITDAGIYVIDLLEPPPPTPSAVTKWVVGTLCVILTVAMAVLSTCFPNPAVGAITGAVSGAAMDIFFQVVVFNTTLENIDWTQVVVSTVSGAVSGCISSGIASSDKLSKLAKFGLEVLTDAIVGGTESTVFAIIDGADFKEAVTAFGMGAALGAAVSGVTNGIAAGLGKLAEVASSKFAENASKKAMQSALDGSVDNRSISRIFKELGRKADAIENASDYIARKNAKEQLEKMLSVLTDKQLDKIRNRAINTLTKDGLLDAAGNSLDANDLRKLFDTTKSGDILGYFDIDGEKVLVKNYFGATASIEFDSKYLRFNLPITDVRYGKNGNMLKAAEILLDHFKKNADDLPADLADDLMRKFGADSIDEVLDDISPDRLLKEIQSSKWVIHEHADLVTFSLVPRALHDQIRHSGGVAFAKNLKAAFAEAYFEEFVKNAMNTFGGAVA